MSEDESAPEENIVSPAQTMSEINNVRYSLKEMMQEVTLERRDSAFGKELVDATEIDKMFSKRRRKKKS